MRYGERLVPFSCLCEDNLQVMFQYSTMDVVLRDREAIESGGQLSSALSHWPKSQVLVHALCNYQDLIRGASDSHPLLSDSDVHCFKPWDTTPGLT